MTGIRLLQVTLSQYLAIMRRKLGLLLFLARPIVERFLPSKKDYLGAIWGLISLLDRTVTLTVAKGWQSNLECNETFCWRGGMG